MNLNKLYLTMLFAATAICCLAQQKVDTLKWWELNSYSETTIKNLAADTENWTPMSKNGVLQRYANKVETDGNTLKANGTIISELDGLLISKGISAGSLLLRHNMGESQNGLQIQRPATINIGNQKAGHMVTICIKSSSKNAAGISAISNMSGDCSEESYPTTAFKDYEFVVKADGATSFDCCAGVVIKSIAVKKIYEDTRPQAEKPTITLDENGIINISSATNDAKIYYSLVNHGKVMDYAREYTGSIKLDYPCTVKALARKEGMQDSEEVSLYADIDYDFEFAGKPFVLDPEKLGHGFIATETSGGMLLSWRCTVERDLSKLFNIKRNGTVINQEPLSYARTTYLDKSGKATDKYTLEEIATGAITNAMTLPNGRLEIQLDRPAGGTTQTGDYEYVPGDCMAGDVDGDGEYEIIMKWDPSNQQDNSISGYTGNVIIDAYRMNGEHLWRIDLGKNIRAGAHYTQLMVYDLDGDGKAELACKTAPGTIDGKGNKVILAGDDANADYRTDVGSKKGVVISGPEYLTVFSGLTGEQLATTSYNPPRNIISAWGDSYGNRSERYLACVAYLDGKKPSLVMCRGYYTAAYLWAVDFDGESLTTKWLYSSTTPYYGAYGEGAHSISVADVDGDLCDEIIYGACAIDNDGHLMYRTGWGHGDAMHVGDLIPDRKGLEVMMVHEETGSAYGVEMHDAMTGEVISGYKTGTDVGRGLCADIDATARGCEYWSTADKGVYDTEGNKISTERPSVNFRTYWDGDVQEEMCEKGVIDKWKGRNSKISTLVNFTDKYGAGTNLIKYTPCLQADIFGDWREEVIYYDNATKSKLWIFSTPYDCKFAVPTLMHDHHYRMATVWQTAAYNQPPHLSYFLPDYVENYTSGIDDIMTQKLDVVSVRYYDLRGVETTKPQSGIFIKKTTYANGTIESKVVRL